MLRVASTSDWHGYSQCEQKGVVVTQLSHIPTSELVSKRHSSKHREADRDDPEKD